MRNSDPVRGRQINISLSLALTLASCVLVTLLAPSRGRADDVGDPVAGHRLASAWCSNCHVIDNNQPAVATGAPTFRVVAANRGMTPMALRAFFQTPHDRMPDLHLSNSEMDDLIAFILSLRGK